jgi:hypothetical protein
LPDALTGDLLQRGREAAAGQRFFHWELEFPEVFHGPDARRLEGSGFDAIIGNPPWEMLRGDSGDGVSRRRAAAAGSALTRFARGSGIYRLQGRGHANLYQLFLERSLGLLRRGGRLGLVLPSGFASDHGCASLRRHVLSSTTVDSFVVAENREGLFPIHRGLKFVVLTLSNAGRCSALPLRSGIRAAAEFDRLPDTGADPAAVPASLRLIEQLSGEQFAIPELRTATDARIAGRIAFEIPAAGADGGWNLAFGRELNATDDRRHFNETGHGLPVIEGKQLQPFVVEIAESRHHVDPAVVERILGRRPFAQRRVAYRDVAASTNKLTLIAAVLPLGTITTHTLFCLKTPLDETAQHFIAGIFNSLVANYLVRLRVTTHVTVAIIDRLPLPKPLRSSEDFRIVAECAERLASGRRTLETQARLQAAAARLYQLDAADFAHVLDTFPLVEQELRAASLRAFAGTV